MSAQEAARAQHEEVLARGEHLFSQLEMYDLEVEGADLAVALELSPRYTNPRGGLVDIHDGIDGPLGAVCTLAWSVIRAPA